MNDTFFLSLLVLSRGPVLFLFPFFFLFLLYSCSLLSSLPLLQRHVSKKKNISPKPLSIIRARASKENIIYQLIYARAQVDLHNVSESMAKRVVWLNRWYIISNVCLYNYTFTTLVDYCYCGNFFSFQHYVIPTPNRLILFIRTDTFF